MSYLEGLNVNIKVCSCLDPLNIQLYIPCQCTWLVLQELQIVINWF